jgi:hypothetical protein
MVVVALGLYIGLALTSGSAWLFPTQRMISRRTNPVGYWTAVAIASAILAISLWRIVIFFISENSN